MERVSDEDSGSDLQDFIADDSDEDDDEGADEDADADAEEDEKGGGSEEDDDEVRTSPPLRTPFAAILLRSAAAGSPEWAR